MRQGGLKILRRQGGECGAVQYQQEETCLPHFFFSPAYALAFDGIFAVFPQSGGIHQPDGKALNTALFFQIVPGCPRLIRDYGPWASQQSVHEAGFSGVDPPGESHGRAFGPDPGAIVGCDQLAQSRSHIPGDGGKFGRRKTFSFFFGKVHGKADPLTQIFEAIAQRCHTPAEQTVESGGAAARPLLPERQ